MRTDIDEFLPPYVLDWCRERLADLGFGSEESLSMGLPNGLPDGRSTDANGERHHKQAYLLLRQVVADHIRSGNLPYLSESIKPYRARAWQPPHNSNVEAYAPPDGETEDDFIGPNDERDIWLRDWLYS